MNEKALLCLGAFIAITYMSVPSADDLKDEESSRSNAGSSYFSDGDDADENRGNNGATLERKSDGHFYADVYINGMETHFLIDTGASTIALTGADALDLGLTWEEDEIYPIGTGASGAVYGVPVKLDTVDLGGFEATSVNAVIIPRGLDVSLLGQSYLSTIDNVSINGDEMVLSQ